jgi:hypothetical protein
LLIAKIRVNIKGYKQIYSLKVLVFCAYMCGEEEGR